MHFSKKYVIIELPIWGKRLKNEKNSSKKGIRYMTQDKMRKVITASVSAATVLFVLLFSYLVYQWVTLAVLDKREQELQLEIQ